MFYNIYANKMYENNHTITGKIEMELCVWYEGEFRAFFLLSSYNFPFYSKNWVNWFIFKYYSTLVFCHHNPNWTWHITLSMYCWISLANIFLRNFTSIAYNFSGIRVVLASENYLETFSLSTFLKSWNRKAVVFYFTFDTIHQWEYMGQKLEAFTTLFI